MKRAHCRHDPILSRLHSAWRRAFPHISLCLCLALLLSGLSSRPIEAASGERSDPFSTRQQTSGQESRVAPLLPRTGPPAANLPNLDEVKRQQVDAPRAPEALPSTMRSRRKPLQLPPGRRPGENAPRRNRISRNQNSAGSMLARHSAAERTLKSHHARTSSASRTSAVAFMPQSGNGTPYGGTPAPIPGTIEAEKYNEGATGIAFYDTSAGSHGQDYDQPPNYPPPTFRQPTDVDMYKNAAAYSNQYLVMMQAGEWMKYSVNVAQSGTYTLQALVAWGGGATGTFHIEVDGVDKTGPITIPDTNWALAMVTKPGVQLTTGQHVMRVVADTNGAYSFTGDIDYLNFTFTGSNAYGGTPSAIPGTIEVENYDNGAAGVAYYDTHPGSHGQDYDQPPSYPPPSFRQPTDVDMYKAAAGYSNGYLIVMQAGDWMNYTVNVAQTGTYTLQARVAWGDVIGGTFHVEVDGVNKTGPIQMPNTGWSLQMISRSGIQLTAGQHLMRIVADSNAAQGCMGDIDYLRFDFEGAAADFAMARLDPKNRTGTGGEDLLSNNFNWSLPLVGLPGRQLDLGLTLSYNSLVWTKSGADIGFDLDKGSIAPGFRLGFPVIEGPYFNSQANANFYLLVTPSGARVELRQTGVATVYESKDSSYLQLKDNLDATLTLQPTDGSQMKFIASGGGWRCNQIKDRNGNYINVTYKSWGEIETITDTLGRTLTFNYDANDNIQSITQTWAGQTQPHQWATFVWGAPHTMQSGFSGVNMIGAANGEPVPVLRQVGLHDGTYFTFSYNGPGQVNVIRRYTSDDVERSRTSYDYDGGTTDCPRLTQARVWAQYWTGLNEVPEEVATQFGHDADGARRMTAPDGTVYKEYYAGSADFQSAPAWQNGLVLRSEAWGKSDTASPFIRQKWTTVSWTQDNPNVNYKTNPRVTQTVVSDGANNRRTTIDYTTFTLPLSGASCSLPSDINEYEANATSIARRTHTDYNLDANYLGRRIIGLPDKKFLYEGTSTLMAKNTFVYDWNGEFLQALPGAPVGHDASHSGAFRGNLVSVLRWDVTDQNNPDKVTENRMGYNITGSVIFTRDALNHQTTIDYADSFSADGLTLDSPRPFSTFAYPTRVTDADGISSTVRYRYDFGAKTSVQGPPPGNPGQYQHGIIQSFTYDAAARIERVTTQNNGAYTHYVYGPFWVQSYSSVNNIAANYVNSDSYSITTFDGVGRAFTTTSNHPGSEGGYKLVNVIFDQMGRPFRQSNPTEVNPAWLPAGDDAYNPATGAGGVRYSVLDFDWQGRTTRKTHPDGNHVDASYSGCGCAGGEVVTVQGEEILVNGEWKRRTQKIYSDVLGRQWKNEVLNWNGTVYSTSVSVFNARDEVKIANQYAGSAPTEASSTNENVSCPDGTCQKTALTYDGYGRLQSKHVPEQNAGTATVYAYNSDDTIHSVTDARGASASYVYNNGRHLVNEINYDAPSGITATSNVTFGYDAAGNRTSMTDGLGSQSYSYNSLSRMTSETRNFVDPSTPFLNASYTLSYDYNLAGELKTIGDPWGGTLNYGFDSTGRLNNVNSSGYGGVTQFTSNLQYRAWGTLKAETYGNGFTQAASYNSRLQITSFEVRNPSSELRMSTTTQFYADGQVKFSHNALDDRFDRGFAYDQLGRASEAFSGSEARAFAGNSNNGPPTGAYRQSYQFSPFGQVTQQTNRLWNAQPATTTNTYTNNRMLGWEYDAAGFVTRADETFYTRDAAGETIEAANADSNADYGFDGDGRTVKAVRNHPGPNGFTTQYWLNSTMLGRLAVAELNHSGQRQARFIYASGRKIAQERYGTVTWSHTDPVTASRGDSNASGGGYYGLAEFNADGINMGFAPPVENGFVNPEADTDWPLMARGSQCSGADPTCQTCYVDGFESDCGRINWEAAEQCADNDCGPAPIYSNRLHRYVGLAHWDPNAQAAGLGIGEANGWLPMGINFVGGSTVITGWGSSPLIHAVSGLHFINNPRNPENDDDVVPVLNKPQNTDFVPLPNLRLGIDALARQGDCGRYIQSLINKVAERTGNPFVSDYITDLFDTITNQAPVAFRPADPDRSETGGTVRGLIKDGNALIVITPQPNEPGFASARNLTPYGLRNTVHGYLIAAIHESIHLAGLNRRYTDRQLAEAAHALPGSKSYLPSDAGDVSANSDAWNAELKKHCSGPKK